MFQRTYRAVGWFFRLSTIGNAYEANNVVQVAKRSISGPSGRKASLVLSKRASVCLGNGKRVSLSAPSGTRSLTEHLRRNYEKFQINDGVPVYLKGGPLDRILFGITCILIAIGLMDGMYALLQMAFPKKIKH